jgi:UrcA family protein
MQGLKLIIVVAVLAAGASQVTLADTIDSEPLSRRVDYSDINLAQQAGARVLYKRLITAAAIVCAPLDSRELARGMKYRSCVHQAVSAAVADIDSPMLTGYYVSSGGKLPQQVAQLNR